MSSLDKANQDLIQALEASQSHEERSQNKIRDLNAMITDLQHQLALATSSGERKNSVGTIGTDSEEKDDIDVDDDERYETEMRSNGNEIVNIVSKLKEELENKEEDIKGLRYVIDAQNGMLRFAETELADMKLKVSAEIEYSHSREDELEDLKLCPYRDRLQGGARVESFQLHRINEELSMEISNLWGQLSASEKLKVEGDRQLNQSEQMIKTLKEENRALNDEINQLQIQQRNLAENSGSEELCDRIATVQNTQEQHAVFEELGSLRSDVKHLQEQLSQTKDALTKVEVDVHEKQNQIVRLEKTIGCLKKENAEHIHELEMIHKDNAVASRSLRSSMDYDDYNVTSMVEQNEILYSIVLREQNKRLEGELRRSNASCEELSREVSKLWDMLNVSEQSRVESNQNLINAQEKMCVHSHV